MPPDYSAHERMLASCDGGQRLIDWHGRVPTFHDAEVIEIGFGPAGIVRLRHWRSYEQSLSLAEPYDLILRLHDVVDLEISYVVHGGILFWLLLQPPKARPERNGYTLARSDDDFELDLEPSVGVGGFIRCRSVSVEFTTTGVA